MNTQPGKLSTDSIPPSFSVRSATLRSAPPMFGELDILLPQMMSTTVVRDETREAVGATLTMSTEEQLAALQREYRILQENHAALQEDFDTYKSWRNQVEHDMRTLVSCISGFAKLILPAAERWDIDRIIRYVKSIIRPVNRLTEITENDLLLEKHKKNGVKLELANGNLESTVQKVLTEIEFLYREKNIIIRLKNTMSGSFAYDEQEIARVFINIIGNAIKFSPSHGEIDISLSNNENYVYIRVSDNGEGIPAKEINSLFKDYSQTERSQKSGQWAGLGLSICRRIIKAHGGEIWVTNNIWGGASFQIELPRTSITTH